MRSNAPGIGRARRAIDLKRWDERTVVGWLEDDFHHFGVTLVHDTDKVIDVHMAAQRYPWITCAGAAVPLRALIGKPLVRRASEIGRLIEMRLQCTHVFDLAGLVLAHAAQGRDHRRYEAIIPDRDILEGPAEGQREFGPTRITLSQNGEIVMWWDIHHRTITAPEAYAGQTLDRGFREWTETMSEDEAEYAGILRRAILIAGGRTMDHDDYVSAGAMKHLPVCHAFQPERDQFGFRRFGATRNYQDHPERMLAFVDEKP